MFVDLADLSATGGHTEDTPCCVMCDRDNCASHIHTKDKSVNQIRLPFTGEKSCAVFHQDDPNPTLQSTVTLHSLLKAVAWQRVIS